MDRFASLDVETANNDRGSICEVGVAFFEGGRMVDTYTTLIDPRAPFGEHQVRVHGITSDRVAGAPPWPMVVSALRPRLQGWLIASHSTFDPQAINAACDAHGAARLSAYWLDTMNVLPLAWPAEFAGKQPRNLKRVADFFDVRFEHHRALDDAKMCGLIVLRACLQLRCTPSELLERVSGRAVTTA